MAEALVGGGCLFPEAVKTAAVIDPGKGALDLESVAESVATFSSLSDWHRLDVVGPVAQAGAHQGTGAGTGGAIQPRSPCPLLGVLGRTSSPWTAAWLTVRSRKRPCRGCWLGLGLDLGGCLVKRRQCSFLSH